MGKKTDVAANGIITINNILVSLFFLVCGIICVVGAVSTGGAVMGLVGAAMIIYAAWPVVRVLL